MAKIDRFDGNLQAPASAALGTERTLFGDVTQSDDLTDQFTADLLRGWGIVGPSDQPTLQDFNAMGFTLGQIHAYLHQMGVAEWNVAQEYYVGSITNVAGSLYASLVNSNVGNAPASSPSQWRPYDFLDTTRINVASAGTVNLTTAAPDTRHINITGTTTINAFTVEAGKCYFVRFNGALTLANNASIVTQRGAPIVTAAGDTCILRATAANVVEVLCYREGAGSASGIVGASRNASMQVAGASATGTFAADEVVVGDASGRKYHLTSVSEAINLAATGAGGMDVGLAPVSGYVALYVAYNPTTLDVALLARDTTSILAGETYGGANMPAGYTASALVSVVRTNASRLMLAHILAGRKVSRATTSALSGSSTQRASPFRLAIDATVPINAKSVSGSFSVGSTAAALCSIGIGSTSAMIGEQATGLTGTQTNPSTGSSFEVPIAPSDPQAVYYTATTSAGTMNASISITGYEF